MTERYCWTTEVGNAAMIQVTPSNSERWRVFLMMENISSNVFMSLKLIKTHDKFEVEGKNLWSPIAFFSVLVDCPGHYQGEGSVDNSDNDGRGDHSNHGLSGEEAGNHLTPRVPPQIHLRKRHIYMTVAKLTIPPGQEEWQTSC